MWDLNLSKQVPVHVTIAVTDQMENMVKDLVAFTILMYFFLYQLKENSSKLIA